MTIIAATFKKVGYPAVMKIVSPDIIHKSDAGGETNILHPLKWPYLLLNRRLY
jgi:hypothetical protein